MVLTFDDGPDPSGTKRLLEALSWHGVKAAFFPIGMKAEAHPDLLREIDQRGHVILSCVTFRGGSPRDSSGKFAGLQR